MARILKDDHTGFMSALVFSIGAVNPDDFATDSRRPLDWSRLDREQIPGWIDHLREAEASTRRLRGRLEALLADSVRRCPVCDTAVTGRADQVYCGATCRQRARRAGA